MKNSVLFAFSLTLYLIAGFCSSWGSGTETFKKADSAREIADVGPEITGAPVLRIWSIKALKEGKSELRFFYYKP